MHGSTIPEEQPQLTKGTELHTLQQALRDSQELRIKDLQLQDSQRHIHALQQELQAKDQQLQDSLRRTRTLQQELRDIQRQNEVFTQHQVEKKNGQVQSIEKDLLQPEQTIGELQAALVQLRRQLQQAQQQVEEKQHAIEERERQVRELTEQLLAMRWPGPLPQKTAMQKQPLKMPQVGAQPHKTIRRPELRQPQEKPHATRNRQLQTMTQLGPPPQKTAMLQKAIKNMTWKKETKAPQKMWRGSAAVDANMAYFNGYGSTTVHRYDSDTRKWCRLPDAPHAQSTLVVVHHILTLVGGLISDKATDSLLSLMGEGRGINWLPNLPAMPTKRYFTAAVCSDRFLIVAGGKDDSERLATVEVLDTDSRQWSIANSLPHPFSLATISICGERLYMLGGFDQTGYRGTHSVLCCSVRELLQSCQTQPTLFLRTTPADETTIWKHVDDAPHYSSSCATFCGQLLAIGGYESGENTSTINGYNETTDSWEAMGQMPTARREALVAILNGKMMVVGGDVGGKVGGFYVVEVTVTDVVEILC